MTNTKTPSTRPAQLLVGTCPICSTIRSAFAEVGARRSNLTSKIRLECGSCGSVSTRRDVAIVTGTALKVVR